jgi:hypothetical protein
MTLETGAPQLKPLVPAAPMKVTPTGGIEMDTFTSSAGAVPPFTATMV